MVVLRDAALATSVPCHGPPQGQPAMSLWAAHSSPRGSPAPRAGGFTCQIPPLKENTAKQRDVRCFALSPSSLPFCHPNTASLAAGLCAQSQCLAKQGEEGIGKSA